MFRPNHIVLLLFSAMFIPLLCKDFQRRPARDADRFLRFSAVLIVFFDPAYWLWELHRFGRLDPATSLPLYVCSLFWMLLPAAVFAKPGRLRQIALANVCTVGMLGGVLGLLFNVYLDRFPFFSFVPLRSLLYHFLMILIPGVLWSTGRYCPRRSDPLLCMAPLAVLLLPCLLLNRLFGWDYCYTAGGLGTPLEHLSRRLPRGLFLLVLYLAAAVLIYGVFYRKTVPLRGLRPVFFSRRRRFSS